ncbi:MAG: hypothetical protein IPN90_07660 [Elusimicrobia bacterium]|nr:hypothetical protein [Elusimicrobiota bacterium]
MFKNGHGKSAVGVDLGGLYALSSRFRAGLSFENANRPDMGLSQTLRLPMITRIGAVFDKTYSKISVEVSQRTYLQSQSDTRLHFGGERQWGFKRYGLLSLRGGAGVGGGIFVK